MNTDAAAGAKPVPGDLVNRFLASLEADLDKWREGTGCDLSLLACASETERLQLESLLLRCTPGNWRQVEALAALNTPGTRKRLRDLLGSGSSELREAVTRFAPQLVADSERIAILTEMIGHGELYRGLGQALDQVRDFHPPEVIDALLDAVERRTDSAVVVHLVALLLHIHGQAESEYDFLVRDYCLRFAECAPGHRAGLMGELRARIGRAP